MLVRFFAPSAFFVRDESSIRPSVSSHYVPVYVPTLCMIAQSIITAKQPLLSYYFELSFKRTCVHHRDPLDRASCCFTASNFQHSNHNDDEMNDDTASTTMQKRRTASAKDATLPLTQEDTKGPGRNRTKGRERMVCGPTFWAVAIVLTLVALVLFLGRSVTEPSPYMEEEYEEVGVLPLSEFETVNRALDNANIVALYFAASWCPMSTPITTLLEEHFSSLPNLLYTGEETVQKKELAIVHVSSDSSESAMQNYLMPGWIAVPFDSDEKNALKKHFSVCAKSELEDLGMERKFEIPTLIILDGETRGVITTNGVHDLEHQGAKALDRWIELQSIIRGLESKYSKTT